jgi:hypothetical protein
MAPIKKKKGAESARIEHCPHCQSVETKNYVYFKRGEKIKVYNECARCGRFVSRYTVTGYTSDKTYESLILRMREWDPAGGRHTLGIVEAFDEDVQREYEHVRGMISKMEDPRKIEEIIGEDYSDPRE